MSVSRGSASQPASLTSTTARGGGSPSASGRVRYSIITARAYRSGGDAAATKRATGGGASAPASTARASSYATIAPRHAPNSAYGLS
jgi:hypothetical protein